MTTFTVRRALTSVALMAVGLSAAALGQANPFLPPQAEDVGWPFVRGPNYDGRSPEVNLADAWPEEGPPVLWVRTLGQGYSGFVARGDRVYTQYQDLGGQYVICLAAGTGETIWRYRYDWPFEMTGMYPGPRATPTLFAGRVYFAGPDGVVGCLDDDGGLVWSRNLKQTYSGQGTDFGCACSPTVIEGKVFVPVGGEGASMVALDARDGALLWKSGDDPASYTPALPITLDGRRQVVGYLENALVGFDLETGQALWRLDLSQGYDEHSAWPIYQEPHLWISGPFHSGSQMLRLPTSPGKAPATVWDGAFMSNDVASSVLVEGHLYGFDLQDVQTKAHRTSRGSFRCLDFATGEQRWSNGDPKQRREPGDKSVIGHASVIAADGKLILLNDTGDLILLRATPERCEMLARATVLGGEIVWTAPALHRGCVYVRNHRQAVCVYVGEPRLLDEQLAAAATTVETMRPAAYFDLAMVLGVEPEYAFDVPSAAWLRSWYLASLAILAVAGVAAVGSGLLIRIPSYTWQRVRTTLLLFTFVLALLGTTLLSLWRGEFVFTWPLALFVVFQLAVDQMRLGNRGETPTGAWRGRLLLLTFLAACLAYFLICRRLSLATEWVFLSGFAAAIPLCLLANWLRNRGKLLPPVDGLLLAASFSAYYWASVAVLAVKYDVS
ncbi:MAG: PQQ-binding-like beta-propeller repeat protein [Pirellulaceae bacterium]